MANIRENIRITQYLRDHHKTIRGLLAQSEASPSRAPSMAAGVEGELLDELEFHCRLEEDVVYPALQAVGGTRLASKVDASFEEHAELMQVVDEVRGFLGAALNQAPLRERIEVIRSLFEAHVEEEEREVFGVAEKILGSERLIEMGRKARQMHTEFFSRPEKSVHRPQRVQNPNGGEQMRKAV